MSTTPVKTDNLPSVVRGGSWGVTSAYYVRAAFRYDYVPSYRFFSVGFRCALAGRAAR